MLRGQAVGHQVESAAGERRQDCRCCGSTKRSRGGTTLLGGAQRLQLGLIDDDVLLGGIGIAGDDGAGLDFAVNGTMLFIADALAAAGMELVEVDLLAGASGGIGFDGDGHQAELQQARPTRAATGLAEPARVVTGVGSLAKEGANIFFSTLEVLVGKKQGVRTLGESPSPAVRRMRARQDKI